MSGIMERMYGLASTESGELPGSYVYAIFRILFGLMFMQHGAQKILGAFGGVDGSGGTAPLFSLFGAAGAIELFAGLLITLGIFTRLAALISAVEMLVAYFMIHFSQGFFPIANKGELALLFFAAFLLIARFGAKRWSLERGFLGREIF